MTRLVVRGGGYQGSGSIHTRALMAMAATLERRSGGTVTMRLTPDVTAAGGRATDLLDQVADGRADLCYFSSSYLVAAVRALAVFERPFTVTDRAAAFAGLDGAQGHTLAAAVRAATAFDVLGYWDNGFRHLSNRRRPIAHPRDCEGLVIRTLDNALHREAFASLGFLPRTIDVCDLVRVVRDGEVDAQENPLANTVGFGLHAHHPFHSLTGHFLGIALLLVNRTWFTALTPDTQALLAAAADEATGVQRIAAVAEEQRCLALLRASGAVILDPESCDMVAFRHATAQRAG